eukprot:94846-Amphidinium_carterae.1
MFPLALKTSSRRTNTAHTNRGRPQSKDSKRVRKKRKHKEIIKYYSMSLEYTLHKATKGEPNKFVQNTNTHKATMDSWRACYLHPRTTSTKVTVTTRIMNPTWDTSQRKQEFIKAFTTWRDEIY